MAKPSKKEQATELRVKIHSIWQAREYALSMLKKSAADLDQLLKNGTVKVGDRFTVGDPTAPSGERDVMVVDNFADANFVWRPLLVERHTVKSV